MPFTSADVHVIRSPCIFASGNVALAPGSGFNDDGRRCAASGDMARRPDPDLARHALAFAGGRCDRSGRACHIVGSWQLLRGGLLYTDFVDNKPPLLYAYYAVAQALGGRGLFAVHLLTAVCVVPLTALAVSACYPRRRTGMIAALTFLLYSAAFIGHDMLATNAEILMVLPASWAIVLMRDERWTADRWRPVAAGFLLGTAVLFKPQIGTWIVAPLAVLLGPAPFAPGVSVCSPRALSSPARSCQGSVRSCILGCGADSAHSSTGRARTISGTPTIR